MRTSWGRLQPDLTRWTCLSQDGKFSFPLESVKRLKDLRELQEPSTRKSRKSGAPVVPQVCSHLKFPEELKPLCKETNAQEILHRLRE